MRYRSEFVSIAVVIALTSGLKVMAQGDQVSKTTNYQTQTTHVKAPFVRVEKETKQQTVTETSRPALGQAAAPLVKEVRQAAAHSSRPQVRSTAHKPCTHLSKTACNHPCNHPCKRMAAQPNKSAQYHPSKAKMARPTQAAAKMTAPKVTQSPAPNVIAQPLVQQAPIASHPVLQNKSTDIEMEKHIKAPFVRVDKQIREHGESQTPGPSGPVSFEPTGGTVTFVKAPLVTVEVDHLNHTVRVKAPLTKVAVDHLNRTLSVKAPFTKVDRTQTADRTDDDLFWKQQ